jgi:hypothetical protein
LLRRLTKTQKTLIAVGVVIVLYIVSLFTPWVSPYTWYPLYVVKCGGPPVAATDFAAAYSYNRPGDKYYGLSPYISQYFCTEAEAKAAGYHHNRLND